MYVRVSTDRQTVENQIAALSKVATARGWQIVETFNDAGISGAKGRRDRPGLDAMLRQAQRGRFDVVMAWAIDRIGRSLIDLLSIHAGLARAVANGTKLGRPLNDPDAVERARVELRKGLGINRVAKLVGLSNGTVQRIKGEMEVARALI